MSLHSWWRHNYRRKSDTPGLAAKQDVDIEMAKYKLIVKDAAQREEEVKTSE